MHISTVPYTHSIFESKSSQSDALVSENHFRSSTQCSWFSINYCFKFSGVWPNSAVGCSYGQSVSTMWTVFLLTYTVMNSCALRSTWIKVTLFNNFAEYVFYIEKRGCQAVTRSYQMPSKSPSR